MIHITQCFDALYLEPTLVSSYSVWAHNGNQTQFHWICTQQADLRARLYADRMQSLGMQIEVTTVSDEVFQDWKHDQIVPYLGASAYLRLLIPYIVKHHRTIYLDSDTITCGALTDLYAWDLNSCHMAGVDNFIFHTDDKPQPPILNGACDYINSGVLLMDLDGLRQNDFMHQVQQLHAKHHKFIMAGEQCLINKYLGPRKVLLPATYNHMLPAKATSSEQFLSAIQEVKPHILHFTDGYKPWHVLSKHDDMRDYWHSWVKRFQAHMRAVKSDLH